MTNDKISKALHGVIRPGGCWHEFSKDNFSPVCVKCGKEVCELWPNYFSREGFWDAWYHAMANDSFVKWLIEKYPFDKYCLHIIKPENFAKNYYDFLVQQGIIK